MTTETSDIDEPISKRRSTRACRLSNLKTQPSAPIQEKSQSNEETVEIEEEIEDPDDLYKIGDIFWVRIGNNPWWPALLYGTYFEDYLHTRVVKYGPRRKRRRYFVYFFGPNFEYSWSDTNCMIPYSGLENFLQDAQKAVQNATTKVEQETLANRFELKVSGTKRAPWDKAIEAADECCQLTREKRIENFENILKEILHKAEKKKRPSKKSLPPTIEDKSSKRQKTKSTSVATSTTLLHVGLPILTKNEEKQIVDKLLNESNLSLEQAQTIACQFVVNLMKENFQFQMTCVQLEWFYDFLLNNPEIVSKHTHWFNETLKFIFDDTITFKQHQLMKILEKK